jgi:hypothetical protein
MMKSNGIVPNGGSPSGQSPPASPSPAKGSPTKATPAKSTPAKGTSGTKGSKGAPSRKRKAPNNNTPSKKGKFKPNTETEAEDQTLVVKDEDGDEAGQLSGGGMYKSATNPDPMLSETAAETADQDAAALFNEFCHPIDSEVETNAKKARRGTKGQAVKEQDDSDAEDKDSDSVILKEESDIIV